MTCSFSDLFVSYQTHYVIWLFPYQVLFPLQGVTSLQMYDVNELAKILFKFFMINYADITQIEALIILITRPYFT